MDRNCCEAIAHTLQRKLSLMARAQGTWHGICFLPGGSASNSLARSSSTAVTMCQMTCCTKNTLQQLSWKLSSQSLCQDVVLHTKIRVPRKRSSSLEVAAIDAAQSFDYESLRMEELQSGNKLKIGIVGFGNFGQFLAQRMISQGHKVLAYSRTDYKDVAHTMGVPFFRDADDFCEEHPEVVLLCTSILSTEDVLKLLPVQRLKRNTLFVDVLSVKEFPQKLFLQVLPQEFDVLCTHPMFGPESGKSSWVGLPFVYDKVRIGGGSRLERCDKFLNIFGSEGCRMVEMSCAEHDRYAAGSQFITHTVGRVLGKLALESTPINTKGYETLLGLVENTKGDSFELYYGLFMYNQRATEEILYGVQLERLELAFDSIKKQLFGRLHDVLRQQLFEGVGMKDGKSLPNIVEDAAHKSTDFATAASNVVAHSKATTNRSSKRSGDDNGSS